MATAIEIMEIVANRTGVSFGRVRNVARRLIESGVWPAGCGATVPKLSTRHVALLLFALLADVPAKSAPQTAQQYFGLRCVDHNSSAGTYIATLLDELAAVDPANPTPQ